MGSAETLPPPGLVRNESAGFYEFVSRDVSTISCPMEARNVEPLKAVFGGTEIIGFRIWDAQPSDTGVEGALANEVLDSLQRHFYSIRNQGTAFADAATALAELQRHRATLSHPPHGAEPVGVVGTMPGTSGFTMAAFPAESVPVGSKLYLAPSASREGGLEEAAKIAHEAHLKYAQLRDSAHPASTEWDRYDACTKTAAAIWHSISALQPKEPRDGRALAKQGGAS